MFNFQECAVQDATQRAALVARYGKPYWVAFYFITYLEALPASVD
jgi:hypothetical protein